MPKPSRREFLTGAAAVVASLPSFAQAAQADLTKYEKNLAKPLSDDAKAKLKANLEATAATIKTREAFPLPENSEPCTIYQAVTAGRK